MRVALTILTGLMMVLTAQAELVAALRPAIREAAAKHGVDPVMMEAIIRHESANATSSAARRKNNLAGIMGRNGQRRFESKEACVEHLAEMLGKYRAKGRVTLVQISRVYCASHQQWVRGVTHYMKNIREGKWGQI
ncbi:MAG: glucosaminidase domain-containing protein [Akkermansia sp.]|nr:glucosaminidase domain-containing protein [Akkermansia sp.]